MFRFVSIAFLIGLPAVIMAQVPAGAPAASGATRRPTPPTRDPHGRLRRGERVSGW